jgi:hypothetical protein
MQLKVTFADPVTDSDVTWITSSLAELGVIIEEQSRSEHTINFVGPGTTTEIPEDPFPRWVEEGRIQGYIPLAT